MLKSKKISNFKKLLLLLLFIKFGGLYGQNNSLELFEKENNLKRVTDSTYYETIRFINVFYEKEAQGPVSNVWLDTKENIYIIIDSHFSMINPKTGKNIFDGFDKKPAPDPNIATVLQAINGKKHYPVNVTFDKPLNNNDPNILGNTLRVLWNPKLHKFEANKEEYIVRYGDTILLNKYYVNTLSASWMAKAVFYIKPNCFYEKVVLLYNIKRKTQEDIENYIKTITPKIALRFGDKCTK